VQGNNAASLAEVCYKPFGEDCATQSLLQYWQMNRTIYEQGFPPHHTKLSPEFCFDHWSTQVRMLTCASTLAGHLFKQRPRAGELLQFDDHVRACAVPGRLWRPYRSALGTGRLPNGRLLRQLQRRRDLVHRDLSLGQLARQEVRGLCYAISAGQPASMRL